MRAFSYSAGEPKLMNHFVGRGDGVRGQFVLDPHPSPLPQSDAKRARVKIACLLWRHRATYFVSKARGFNLPRKGH